MNIFNISEIFVLISIVQFANFSEFFFYIQSLENVAFHVMNFLYSKILIYRLQWLYLNSRYIYGMWETLRCWWNFVSDKDSSPLWKIIFQKLFYLLLYIKIFHQFCTVYIFSTRPNSEKWWRNEVIVLTSKIYEWNICMYKSKIHPV